MAVPEKTAAAAAVELDAAATWLSKPPPDPSAIAAVSRTSLGVTVLASVGQIAPLP